jgi:dTDP-4-amino-4,6-dideoxygalactose transaminase
VALNNLENNQMIIKEPVNRREHARNFYFVNAARIAFAHILKSISSDTDKKILMPSYIGETDEEGSGVFDPVRETRTSYGFYPIHPNLSADFEDLERKIVSGDYGALLIIHYFGFVENDMDAVAALCKKHQVILIEDCAHSFFSSYKGRKIGTWGDVSFFSIHKIIATDDGGYFQINNEKIGVVGTDFENRNMSSITLEQFIRSDYEKINRIRKNNYQRYLDKWPSDTAGVHPLYPILPEEIIPLNFPIIVHDGLREKVYFKLVENGIVPCALYYRMVHEIDKTLFPNSYEISDSIINLPVHQDTTSEDIDYIILKLKESMAEVLA